MKYLFLLNHSLGKIFHQLLGWLLILLFYSFGNNICIPGMRYNFLSLFNLCLSPYLNASFFVNLLGNHYFIKLIKYFNLFFYLLYSLVMTDNLSYYLNAPKTFFFYNKRYLYFLFTLFSGSTILLWFRKNILFINLLYKINHRHYFILSFLMFVENIYNNIPINYVQHQNLHFDLPFKLNNFNKGIIFFYIFNRLNPLEIAENLNKSGAIIEGLRPGKETVKYLTKVIYNINFLSSYYIIIICVLHKYPLGSILTLMETAIEILNQIKELFMPAKYEYHLTKIN